jgi:RNA polymerase sigma-70 factor (ECF subfamily)
VAAEDQLIARSRGGDTGAFDLLVERYQDRVYGLAYRITGHHADAQDAAQESFLKAYRSLRTFRGDASFSTWLHRIAVNAALDAVRRRASASPAQPGPNDEPSLDPLADRAERVEARERIQRAISALPIEQRVVVTLRDVQGWSYEEIAVITEIPVGTVRSRLARGREALRVALADLAPPAARANRGGNAS